MIYLDNAATTQISPGVLEAVTNAMREDYGNPGTLYDLGKRAKELVSYARKQVADCIGAREDQIVFTSGGSESNATVIFGVADWMKENEKDTVVVSAIEHESVLKSAKAMCMKHGFHLHILSVDSSGHINPAELQAVLNAKSVGLVSIMYVNNEIGAVQHDMNKIAELCHENGALFHTDCVQALGSDHIDVAEMQCDFLSMSAHKVHGPKGVGGLYVSDLAKHLGAINPLVYGGNNQEFGLRGGTENVSGIVGFGEACSEVDDSDAMFNRMVYNLLYPFVDSLKRAANENGISDRLVVNGAFDTWKIVRVTIRGVDNEMLAMLLNKRGICVGIGSACNSRSVEPSHVLKAIGMSNDDAMSTIRVSFSKYNTPDEAETAAREIVSCGVLLLGLIAPGR